MRRNAHAYRIQPARNYRRNGAAAFKHHGERAGQKFLRKAARVLRNVADNALYVVVLVYVDNQRVVLRTTLNFIYFFYGFAVESIGAQPVYRFGGKGDEPALFENFFAEEREFSSVLSMRVSIITDSAGMRKITLRNFSYKLTA